MSFVLWLSKQITEDLDLAVTQLEKKNPGAARARLDSAQDWMQRLRTQLAGAHEDVSHSCLTEDCGDCPLFHACTPLPEGLTADEGRSTISNGR